ncbi:MAG: S1 RNA-binding domain-containing protein, partial [Anaerolineales bacterium]
SRTPQSPSDSSDNNSRWKGLVDEHLELKIIGVEQERNRLILSERAAASGLRQQDREQLLAKMSEGDVLKGQVTSVVDFGAFIDVGGLDGLVHISEMSWHRVAHPRDVVQPGDSVQVCVLRVDKERSRVALSIKRLLPDPWTTIGERYEDGQLLEGVITRLTDWGAFAEVVGDEAIEGLIHVSQLDVAPVVHPRDVVQPGQRLTLRVVDVDPERRRLGLSLKQAVQGETVDADWRSSLPPDEAEPQTSMSTALSTAINSDGPPTQARSATEGGS